MIRDMKSLKILSLVALLAALLVGCEKEPVAGDNSPIVGEWELVEWNKETPEFNVYISFDKDGSFEIYQQVWSFDYELFTGSYTVSGDILTGTYADGKKWASGYKFSVADGVLTLYSQEDQVVESRYQTCTIPEEIKAEATTTRSSEVVPFL